MGTILVVCTGNVCRSPSAEGFLRREVERRMGEGAPVVKSAGTEGWEGSPATTESVRATAERGVDIAGHIARRLGPGDLAGADLIVAMAGEHREAVARMDPDVAGRTFTLKELVRLLEASATTPGTLLGAADEADALRREGGQSIAGADDVADPLGMSLDTYRAMALELDSLTARLADAALGVVTGEGAAP